MRMSIGWPPTFRPTRPSCGQALLGDVEARHDLQARGDAGDHAARHRGGVVEDAVHAVANPHVLALRLEVDVGRALLDALRDHAVDELDHGSIAGRLADLGDLAAGLLLVLLDRLRDRGVELGGVRNSGVDVLGGRDRGAHVEAGHDRDVVDRPHVGRVRHRHQQRLVADEGDRDRAVALGRLAWNQVHGAEIDLEHTQVEMVEAEPLGRRTGELVAGDRPGLEQHLLGRHTARACFGDRGVDLRLAREAHLDDVVGDETAGAAAAGGRCQPGALSRLTGDRRSLAPSIAGARKHVDVRVLGVPARRRSAASRGRRQRQPLVRREPASACELVCQSAPSVAPLLIAPSGACNPVQIRKLAAPWWTRTSNPSTQLAPRAWAARRSGVRS